jgi:uncharacterized protein YkwD
VLVLAGLLTLIVVVAVGFYLGRHVGGRTKPAASGGSAAPLTASATPSASPSVTHTAPASRSVTHTASLSPTASRSAASNSAPGPATPAAGPAAAQQSIPADRVLTVINQARAAAGLPAYTISTGLDLSAGRHDTVMASGCGLSHQCPGEAALGTRETAAGVTWTSAGENIGEGGPVASTATAIAQMAVTLTQDMLAEKPPDDGHRLNILSNAFHHIGIAVYRDSAGTVWMTQDFSN